MVIILVHWMIKKNPGSRAAFEAKWQSMTIQSNIGLYREILTRPLINEDPKFNTFSLTDQYYDTYINVGIWKDLASFDTAVGQYIQPPEDRAPQTGGSAGRVMKAIYMEDFEFKIRERIVLEKLWDRQGMMAFEQADLR